MKRSRSLIIVLMLLAIITCVTAGTLAVYTTTIDKATSTTVTGKQFIITTDTMQREGVDIRLAPDDVRGNNRGEEYYFTVRNYDDNGVVAEVPIRVSFALTDSGDIFKINGIDIKIIDGDHKDADAKHNNGSWIYGYSASRNGLDKKYPSDNAVSNIILPAGVKTDRHFRIRYQWLNNDGQDAAHTRAGMNNLSGTLSLTVIGEQVVDQVVAEQ